MNCPFDSQKILDRLGQGRIRPTAHHFEEASPLFSEDDGEVGIASCFEL